MLTNKFYRQQQALASTLTRYAAPICSTLGSMHTFGYQLTMPRNLVFALLTTLLCACSDGELQYGPKQVELTGQIVCGKREHPNGELFDFCLIQLAKPVSIAADSDNEFNTREESISEIQVFSDDSSISTAIAEKRDRKVTVKGELFHEHTAWHVRKIVMDVKEIR
ncbi:MAG TPA: hypothetical protein DCS87_03430 [Rheinheimera sp.]|nr:hypothetical protein [Rheinheimera sp.]